MKLPMSFRLFWLPGGREENVALALDELLALLATVERKALVRDADDSAMWAHVPLSVSALSISRRLRQIPVSLTSSIRLL
jgi:hypothetical protein